MSSFTRDADRNRVLVCCATTKVPVLRSNTAMPARTPAGTATAEGDGDGDGDGDGELAAGGSDGDGASDGADQTVTGAGPWQPASVAPSSAAATTRRNLIRRSLSRCR